MVALDIAFEALRYQSHRSPFDDRIAVNANAAALPFHAASFDLVFSQLTLLWTHPLASVLDEIARVLASGGSLVALEPDYGGMIEHPPEIATRDLWIAALERAGANPYIGRSLPGQLEARGFRVHVALFDTLYPPSVERFDFLRDLPLEAAEQRALEHAAEVSARLSTPWEQIAHLPFFIIYARKPER